MSSFRRGGTRRSVEEVPVDFLVGSGGESAGTSSTDPRLWIMVVWEAGGSGLQHTNGVSGIEVRTLMHVESGVTDAS